MTALRPFFSYFGGKWRNSAKLYPKPIHNTLVEPFAGSAGYALRYPAKRVILCDLDPIICGVWRYLISVSADEILSLPDVTDTIDDLDVGQEAKWLIGFWLNRATTHPCKSPSQWMRAGYAPTSFWGPRVRATIASQLHAIRHWEIHQCSYQHAPDVQATWFVDPPYQVAGTRYRFGSKGMYFGALARWCRSRQGQTIVCEASGASWLPFQALAHTKSARPRRPSKEAVWLHHSPQQLSLFTH